MKEVYTLLMICLVLMTGPTTGCSRVTDQEVTFDGLFSNINAYNGKDIIIEGFYFQGWEVNVLSERLELSGYAEGHLVPKGRMIWVSGGISKEVYDKLNQQQQMGPIERFGKVRIIGKFEYGGKYGHLGGYEQQITPTKNIILSWSPSASVTFGREGFAIYLTRDDIPPAQMEALSHVDITDQPIISIQDIITYNAQTHEIELTDVAFERISQLEVPVSGKSFLICIDKSPVYWGAFWIPISSMSFNGVTIWKPLDSQEQKVITIELGYPSSSFYSGEDPRNNPVLMKSLDQAGKLINKLLITAVDILPHSLKGYELYSWEEDNQWYFILITATNRTKTLDEITSEEDFISETGWIKIQVVGADAIKDVLSRLPQGESLSWCDELHIGQLADPHIDLKLPPVEIVDAIKEHAEQCDLEFALTLGSY